MNDTVPPTHPAVDAGAQLRQARERAGLHIATLAATLKVPVQRLQALEAGAYDALPDATFTRALALSVCRALKIDPAPILAALPAGPAPRLTPASGDLATPMPREGLAPAFAAVSSGASARRWSAWLASGLLVAAALAWWLLPPRLDDPASASAAVSEPVAAPAAGGSVTESASTAAAAVSGAAATGGPGPAAPVRLAEAAPPPPVPEAPAAAASAALMLRTTAASWVQVTGASGRVWLQRNVQPGETLRFDEDLPLTVVVGRADATVVEVRGQSLDLGKLARNNVARFEVR
ncbi:MAG: DUF4115 domain-containing protein [Tepidimonas sp.]|uniref:helix-turn-helix domain-containing protein n=1 Tax=Tepidimonas sp. TaxID=2002775 RepID=UPI00298ED92C|nr:RodZ domain-containing protein [Tepidimonas sp.]MCS6811732.1 DUF4115 domain-containing protein [Tepidimonas sp.]MDW8336913.1 DUF4115 domain-containing protein [Tepidimonas sp.]